MSKMNKKQYAIIVLSIIGTLLYFNMGASRPIFDPINIAVYGIAGVAIIIVLVIVIPTRYCPNCGAKLPRIRRPENANEALFGWTTCPSCKSEIDTSGRIVTK
jgi:hypothetical protein